MTGLAVIFAVIVWFLSTGLILWLVGAPRRMHGGTMIGASVALAASVAGLAAIAPHATPAGAFAGFLLGIVVWGWHETSFLLGFVTGPRVGECPRGLSGWRRFVAASETVIFHELAIAATALLLIMLTWRAPNQVGVWTYLLLWGMRLCAKANIFVGAPHVNVEFLPPHLAHLKSYFGPKRLGAFFFVSTASIAGASGLLVAAAAGASGGYEAAAMTLLATLAILAVLEHLFMALPVRDAMLWAWARPAAAQSGAPDTPCARPGGSDA